MSRITQSNPVLNYFNRPENDKKTVSTRKISKEIGIRQKDVFYYILNSGSIFERAKPLEIGFSGNNTRCFRKRDTISINSLKTHPQYPDRLFVPQNLIEWSILWSNYCPPQFTANSVLNNARTNIHSAGWADPELINDVLLSDEEWNSGSRKSYVGIYKLDEYGYPLNPRGRTGLSKRGLLGKWGPNHAADPIVTRYDPDRPSILQVIAIQRRDTGMWALPGGMVDIGEHVTETVRREFTEEAGNFSNNQEKNHFERLCDQLFTNGKLVYQGYVDDVRNTDNAWLETSAYHYHCCKEIAKLLKLNAGDDAQNVKWIDIDNNLVLHANHGDWIKIIAKNPPTNE